MRRRIFISYRRKENAWAIAHLRDRLCVEYGSANVFLDTHEIHAGEDWKARLERELYRSDVVVLVHGESWLGNREDGTCRICDEDDPVRFELVKARSLDKLIVPIAIDSTEVPSTQELPPDLQFVTDLHFERLQATISLEDQINRLIVQIRDRLHVQSPLARLMGQALWVSLVALALVACLDVGGLLRVFQDAYAVVLQPHMSRHAAFSPEGVAYISVDDAEYAELFAWRTPLNPEVLTIVVDRLHDASKVGGMCGRTDAPVGFYIDLGPGAGMRQSSKTEALAKALLDLSNCRPVVLVCPSSLKGGAPAPDDYAWVQRLRGASPSTSRVTFSSPDLDPKVLRLKRGRYEFGAVMGDIAAGRTPFVGEGVHNCVCPASREEVNSCKDNERHHVLSEFDPSDVIVPTGITNYTLSWGLDNADDIVPNRMLIVGTHYGRHGRYSVGSFDQHVMVDGTPGVHVESFVAHQASGGMPFRSVPELLVAVVSSSLLTSAGLMLLWVALARHLKFKRRVAIYAGILALTVGHLLLWAAAAALEPRLMYVATFATLAVTFTALRSLLTGYEVLLNGGVEWRSIRSLWLAIRERRDRSSAIARMVVVMLEVLVLVAGGSILLMD